MKINEINSLKKKDYIVLLPKCDYDIYDSVTYSFHNVFYLDYSFEKNDAQILIDYVNQTENMQLILFDKLQERLGLNLSEPVIWWLYR